MALVADYCEGVSSEAAWTAVLDGNFVFAPQDLGHHFAYDTETHYRQPCDYGQYIATKNAYIVAETPEANDHTAAFGRILSKTNSPHLLSSKTSPIPVTRTSSRHSSFSGPSVGEPEYLSAEQTYALASIKPETVENDVQAWRYLDGQLLTSDSSLGDMPVSPDDSYIADPAYAPYVQVKNTNQKRSSDPDANSYKKRKLNRLSPEQVTRLKETFESNPKLNQARRVQLAQQLNLNPRQIEVWFQNKRAKLKIKNTESQFDTLKKAYDDQVKTVAKLEKINAELQKQVSILAEQSSQLSRLGTVFPDDDRPIRDASGNFDTTDLIIAKSDGALIKVSPSMVELLGFSEDELLKLSMQSLLQSEERACDIFNSVMSGQIVSALFKETFRHKQGHYVVGQWKLYGVRNSYGEMYLVSYVRRLPVVESCSRAMEASSSEDESDCQRSDY